MTSSKSKKTSLRGIKSQRKFPNSEVMCVARKVAYDLVSKGAEAVVLMGSQVRGDAYTESDIDICAIGRGPFYRLHRIDGYLFSISWRTSKAWRQEFRKPSGAGGAIPGWRSAIILHDSKDVAADLKCEAKRWNWNVLGKRREVWVAEEFTGWAEEVHRLIGNLELGRSWAAAIQRSVLAIQLAPILAIHHKILYETENQLWDLVGKKMGKQWSIAQSAALGIDGESLEDSCKAALELFIFSAKELETILDNRQHKVVGFACEIATKIIGSNRKELGN